MELDHVDFVKVYCAGSANAGWLGEWSTEVLGIGITTPDPDYVPQDYYLNYIGITQLQVIQGQECQFEGSSSKRTACHRGDTEMVALDRQCGYHRQHRTVQSHR